MAIPASIERFVRDSGVAYTPIHHRVAFTAQEEAAATHVPGREWAKTVVCIADGMPILVVLPAHFRVDLYALRTMLSAREVRLAAEHEFSTLYPECETGAMAPFGALYNQAVFVDESLASDPYVVFNAGTHVDAMRMKFSDFLKLAKPTLGRIAIETTH
jgi:Ala-tRNA(Pro) deacylase